MKIFKYLLLSLLIINLTACGGSEETEEITETTEIETTTETMETTETETVTEAVDTPEIVESEDITDLGLDNALLELDLVE
jgi:ABC-type Fe3+-hydroxamate transport system substrate-binding protein